MKFHILADNRTTKRGFLAEHGLSVLIEHEKANILFDTGQSDVFIQNAMRMGKDLNRTDFIVLSHGHYDHCGGLIHIDEAGLPPKIYLHETAFEKRYALNPDQKSFREIGIPWSLDRHSAISRRLVRTKKTMEISRGVRLLGEIPSTATFEGVPEGFLIGDEANGSQDMIKDEQMLILETDKGLCIFVGCAHPGIVSCLQYAMKSYPGKKIHTLVGGMHMSNCDPLRLEMTVHHMITLGIEKIVPLHCTGLHAIAEMKRLLGDRCLVMCAGDAMEI